MTTENAPSPPALRLAALLLLAGQVSYIAITQFHAGGDANDHHSIFETYAENGIWTAVHLGQFLSMAMLLAGLVALCLALEIRDGRANWFGRLGAAAATAALALHGVLQAVDGVALKQAVTAWANAPDAERLARFASAETMRWLEWGMRSYEDFTLGLALLLFALAAARSLSMPRPIAYLMALSALAYFAQGWVAATAGFAPAQSIAIVTAWALCLAWMIWLALLAQPSPRSPLSTPAAI